MVVEGGMGVVTQQLAAAARQAGAHVHTGAAVQSIEVQDGRATGVQGDDCWLLGATNCLHTVPACLQCRVWRCRTVQPQVHRELWLTAAVATVCQHPLHICVHEYSD